MDGWIFLADEMVPKSENGQAANRRLTRYIMLVSLFHIAPLIYIPLFIITYHATHTVHVHSGAIRKLMCGLFACSSDNPLSLARELASRTHAQPMK